MVDIKIHKTTCAAQLDISPLMISPLHIENQFNPLSSVDAKTNIRRIIETYPLPLVQTPPPLITLGLS